MAAGAKGAMGTRGPFRAHAGRVLLALSASTCLTAVVALPMAYQAHAARELPELMSRTTEAPPSVLGTSTVPTTLEIPETSTTTSTGSTAPDADVSTPPSTTTPPSTGGRSSPTTTTPRIVSPEPPTDPTTTTTTAPSPPIPPETVPTGTTTTTVQPRLSPEGLYFSSSFMLVPATQLDAAQIGGFVYVFLDLPDVAHVDFFLDDVLTSSESFTPWELFGGVALDPTTLSNGSHTVRAEVTFSDGHVDARAAVFTTSGAR